MNIIKQNEEKINGVLETVCRNLQLILLNPYKKYIEKSIIR